MFAGAVSQFQTAVHILEDDVIDVSGCSEDYFYVVLLEQFHCPGSHSACNNAVDSMGRQEAREDARLVSRIGQGSGAGDLPVANLKNPVLRTMPKVG
jgi:hypothetical protein